MSCGVDGRGGSALALLGLWRRLAAAAPIRPLAWELPYAAGGALRRKEKTQHSYRDEKGVLHYFKSSGGGCEVFKC